MTQSYGHADKAGESAAEVFSAGDVVDGAIGSRTWFLGQADRGQHLLERGQVEAARDVFQATLVAFSQAPSYERCAVMERLGRCLLLGNRPLQAISLIHETLASTAKLPPTDGVKGLQGILQSALGDALFAARQYADARRAYEAAVKIAERRNDLRGQGVDHGHLGTLALADGRIDDAADQYRLASKLFQRQGEVGSQALALHQLGVVLQETENWGEAEQHFTEAARLREESGDYGGAALSLSQLASLKERSISFDAAEQAYRAAVTAARRTRNPDLLRRHAIRLAAFLVSRDDKLPEAWQLAEEALITAASVETVGPDVWSAYGILADIIEKQVADADGSTPTPQQSQAAAFHHIQHYGPRLQATLAKLGTAPSYGRVVVMERLGRCFAMGGRPDLAATLFSGATEVSLELPPGEGVTGLQGVLQSDLGNSLGALGQAGASRQAYEAALTIAQDLKDIHGEAIERVHLGQLALMEGRLDDADACYRTALSIFRQTSDVSSEANAQRQLDAILLERGEGADQAQASEQMPAVQEPEALAIPGSADFEIEILEELMTDCAFDTDLLIDVRRQVRMIAPATDASPLPENMSPVLVPNIRMSVDDEGAVRLLLPSEEPVFERHPNCVVMHKARREITIRGLDAPLSRLIRDLDGARTVDDNLSKLAGSQRAAGERLLAQLAAGGAIDLSGRPMGKFIHSATKKGVLAGGGLETEDVLRLATDGDYRVYAEARCVPLAPAVPERLSSFHALTRARRSRRDYAGLPIARQEFDALLHTACGVTGAMLWEGRQLDLRAYPSSGALYAVEIYPAAFRVDDLDPGVYHYVAGANTLNIVCPDVGLDRFVSAALPVERDMVSGAAAMICLVGRFRRHEQKYGEGGYRMMVAEAGHISQNLVLTAVALGLSARPFGGVFDGIINEDLGLDETEEQFLLSVLVGHAGENQQEKRN